MRTIDEHVDQLVAHLRFPLAMTPKAVAQIKHLRRGHAHVPTQPSTQDVAAA